jgi:salicylate hydroxylase
MAPRIRVAICGGGIAGSCLFHSLLQHQHLDVHIFESASNFKDVGGALGITRNAIMALELIGPSAKESLDRAGAVPMGGVRFMLAAGENQGALIDEANAEVQSNRISSIVHRGTLVREFLRDLPQERMHASKKLERVASGLCEDGSTERLTLQFDDGTTHECDVLIGADGIRSLVRKTILGEEDPATYPRNTGTWAIMTLKPYDEAQAAFGPELINKSDTREYMWVGDGSFFLHNVLDSGDTAQIILSSNDASVEQKDAWKRKVGVEEMKDLCKDWPRELNRAVHELLCNQEQSAIYLWEHLPARTYVRGSMCIMGDAAHSTTFWQGAGGGMCVEDSLMLSCLLGRARTAAEATAALGVYSRVRLPRTQRIVESSRETGEIMNGKGEHTGLDLARLSKGVLPRWDFIVDFDNKQHVEEALEMLESDPSELRRED